MKWKAIGLALMVSITGCSSVSKKMTFDYENGQSFALITAGKDYLDPTQIYTFEFHRIDFQSRDFLPQKIWITFSYLGPIQGDEFTKPSDFKTDIRFGGEAIAPGDYALVSRSDNFANRITVNCYQKGATVFRFNAGSLNVLPMGKTASQESPEKIRSDVMRVMRNYPNMNSPISFAQPIGSATFETSKDLFGGKTCLASKLISFSPLNS